MKGEKEHREKIFFSMPNSFIMVPQETASTMMLNMHMLTRQHTEIKVAMNNYMSNLAIAAARNHEFHLAAQMDSDWLWFLDTDHKFPLGSFNRLYETARELRRNDPKFLAVGGLYLGRTGKHPAMGTDRAASDLTFREMVDQKSVVKTPTVPTGFMLINIINAKKLFKKLQANRTWLRDRMIRVVELGKFQDRLRDIKDPLMKEAHILNAFAQVANAACQYQAHLPALFVGQYTEKGELVTTEDYFFTHNAQNHGFNCYIDCGAYIQHMNRELWLPPNRDTEPTPRPPPGIVMEVRGHTTDSIVSEKNDGDDKNGFTLKT